MKKYLPFRRSMRIIGEKRTALDTARSRITIVSALFVLGFIMVGVRVVDLTFIQGEMQEFSVATGSGHSRVKEDKDIPRGNITDRNGILLATSLRTASLYADPAIIANPKEAAQALVNILPTLSYGDLLQKLQRKARFIWIKRNLTPDEQFAVLSLGEPGFSFQSEWRRIYPQGPLAAHIVGFTDIDSNGIAGIERSFDGLLEDGASDLKLTLDIRVQHIVRRELERAIKDFNGIGGAATVVDLSDGEILAAVSYPDFDPNDIGAADDKSKFNRLTLGVYELGSVFKIFSSAALLETHGVPLSTGFDTREPLVRGRFTIRDYHPEKRVLSIPEVFMHSSNIGAAMMGEMVGTQNLKDFYEDLGLLSPLSLEIEEVGRPLVPEPWRDLSTLTASFGHGIAVSPLQMTVAAGSIVADGTLIRPTFIIPEGVTGAPKKQPEIRIISPQTAHRMRQMMRLVVTDGTGKNAAVSGYRVGGKTGTAEKPDARGRYDRKKQISSFIGFFPMDAPRYAVYVMVDEPKGTKASFGYATGGWVASPAVRKIIEGMAAVLAIPPMDLPTAQDLSAPLRKYVHDDKGAKHLASFGTD